MEQVREVLKNRNHRILTALGTVLTWLGIQYHWGFLLVGVPMLFLALAVLILAFFQPQIEKRRQDQREEEREAREKQRQKNNYDTQAIIKREFFSDGIKSLTLDEIREWLRSLKVDLERWDRGHDITLSQAFHLDDFQIEWCDSRELRSISMSCQGGAYHGECEIIYEWGWVSKNYVRGVLHGPQSIFMRDQKVLHLTFIRGHFETANFSTNWGEVRSIAEGRNRLNHELSFGHFSASFSTLAGKPEMSWQRSRVTDTRKLSEYQISTGVPLSKVSIKDSNGQEAIIDMSGFKIGRVHGDALRKALGAKTIWSPLAFLHFDYRFCLGQYEGFILNYDSGYRGPPGLGTATWDFSKQLISLTDLFEIEKQSK